MEILENLKMYWRFAWGLRSYVRRTLTLDEARDIIKRRLAQREDSFLRIVRRTVFEYPQSPYLPLMKLAGCDYGDIENLVRSKGLEATLHDLREAGVYVSFEELKGRIPIERGGKSYEVTTSDFENPYLKGHFQAESGGTTGPGRRIPMELDYIGEQAPQLMVARHAHDCLDLVTAQWRGPIPDSTGIAYMLRAIRYGRIPQKWFTAHLSGDAKPSLGYRLAESCFVNTLRLLKVPIPRPVPLRQDQADSVARWAADMCRIHGGCCVLTSVGRAMRIAVAALDAGIDLNGTFFLVGSEPFSQAKAQTLTSMGTRYFLVYAMYETGHLALGCANPDCSDDMHLSKDCFGLIGYPIRLADSGVTINAVNITTLLPSAPLVLLNTQVDDYAVIEERDCGCPLGELGYDQHLSQVGSYSKLVAEGVSFVGSDLVKIMEEVLPAEFGGTPLDYQLLEEEDEMGLPRISLLVSPRVPAIDDERITNCFFQALKGGPASYDWAQSIWKQGRTLHVRRREPFTTARGKHLTIWRRKINEKL